MLMYGFISIQAHLNTIGLSVGDLLRMLRRYDLIRAGSAYCSSFHTNVGQCEICVCVFGGEGKAAGQSSRLLEFDDFEEIDST